MGSAFFSILLDEVDHWAQRLSPGEQQRVALARAVLHAPDWLFLDEATSALDEATEARVYGVLRTRLPETTLVSIAHRPAIGAFHHASYVLVGATGDTPGHLVAAPAGRGA